VWDSEKACEVSGRHTKALMVLRRSTKLSRMSDWISVGVWRFLRFCNKWMLKALMFSRCLLVRSLLGGLKISIGAFTALVWYNSRPLEREAGLPRTESLICLSIGTY
jgi:hypothetical protein